MFFKKEKKCKQEEKMLKKILEVVSIIVMILLLVVIIQQQHTLKALTAVQTEEYASYYKPAKREPSGAIVPFGTITFDDEDRVWILRNFIVPPVANYSFSYQYDTISSAPFFTGAELSPKTGKEFRICYNVTGECEPPVEIMFAK